MIAKFQGGPFHGQSRIVQPEETTSDTSEAGQPPLMIRVVESREGEILNHQYLRRREKVGSAWEYLFVRPQEG